MLEVESIAEDMESVLKEYCEIPEIIQVNENLPPGQKKERIVYQFSSPYKPDNHDSTVFKDVVPSEEPGFEYDIEYSYISYPRVKLNLTGYGEKDISEYMGKAHDWFRIPKLGKRFFENFNIVIIDTTEIENQDIEKDNEYYYQRSFDVILQFEEVVKVREKTIEELQINNFGEQKENYKL